MPIMFTKRMSRREVHARVAKVVGDDDCPVKVLCKTQDSVGIMRLAEGQ